MYTSAKMAREAMLPHSGSWSINEAILVGGQATADNLAPHISQIQYSWRAPTLEMQQRIYEVLENTAKHVAEMTHCKFTGSWVTKTRPGLPNHVMADLTYKNLEQYGAPRFDEKANDFAREIQKNLGIEPMDAPFASEVTDLISPQNAETILRKSLPEWQKNYTSDDYVDYTWHTPTARLYIGRPMLKSPGNGKPYPAWAMNALGGYPASIDPMIFSASRCIAGTLMDLLMRPEILEKANAEFVERTGGGIGGEKWIAPLLPEDFKPPVHFRWPEYIKTSRGEEWWIPTEPGDQ
jgi:aminobenzoyl-glutamate utilization protein B